MERYNRHRCHEGSITVFLSLILLLVLSLVLTVIEGARQSTARIFAERSLITSMDSVLAGFYGPLMKEYHILGLYASDGEASETDSIIAQNMLDYISYTLSPGQGLYGAYYRLNMHNTSLETLEILDKVMLVDYRGKIFTHEVTEYMKYKTLGNVAEFFLDKASLLEQPKKVSVIYEEKVALEEKLVTIDEGILALMKYIDGLSTSRKGLLKGKSGTLRTEQCYAKKILFGSPTMESVGINNEAIFLALQDEYTDPTESLKMIDSSFERLEKISAAVGDLNGRIDNIREEKVKEEETLKQLEERLADSEKKEIDTDDIKSDITEAEERISELDEEKETILQDIEAYKEEEMNCINTIRTYGFKISELASGSLTATEQAIAELEQIIITSQEAGPLIISYENSLERHKGSLDESVLGSLLEGLEEIKRYQTDNENGYDFPGMKEKLANNYKVLRVCVDNFDKGSIALSDLDYKGAKKAYDEATKAILSYDTNGLNINYSTLVIDDEDTPDYLDSIKELIEEGITSLVIDPKTISENEISMEMLPSVIEMISDNSEGFSFSTMFKGMSIGNKSTGMGGLFGSFGDYSLGALIGNAADEILERILVQQYIDEHYYRFPVKEEEKEGRKPTVLTYEWEYLICGNGIDKENLQAVIGRLILLRTLLNFVTILGDKEKWSEAKTIASKLVGFTGLPILVAITQGLLMILLAFASGLVDTCALLIGKELPILKKKVELRYSDLLILTRDNIRSKASGYKDENGFSYKDYLTLFLCLTNRRKLTYRMMDLIQENIKVRYGVDFNMQNCVFGYEAKATFKVKPAFTTLQFMHKYINKDINKELELLTHYSY